MQQGENFKGIDQKLVIKQKNWHLTMYCNKYNSLDKDTDLSSEIENNYMVFLFYF